MKGLTFFIASLLLLAPLLAQTAVDPTESHLIEGIKYSEDKTESVSTKALVPNQDSFLGGFNELLPFVMPAPYQDNAGSCLFMSHTGAVEVLLNQKSKTKTDLSERYFMNLQKASVGENRISNWRTDTIFRLNETTKMYKNKDFRFSKGWYKTKNGKRVYAKEEEQGAFYGTRYNWVIDTKSLAKTPSIKLPELEREVIFADPSENQWNVGTAPSDIVTRVKNALKKNKAPVIVIYNHVGFWHANLVVGYNDKTSSDGCPFVSNYNEKMNKRADEIIKESTEVKDPKQRRKLERKAANFRRRGQSVHDDYLAKGGCSGKGVFYVRDSIYPQEDQPLYDYDLSKTGEEQHMNASIILREYEWLERLSNHAVQIRFK